MPIKLADFNKTYRVFATVVNHLFAKWEINSECYLEVNVFLHTYTHIQLVITIHYLRCVINFNTLILDTAFDSSSLDETYLKIV